MTAITITDAAHDYLADLLEKQNTLITDLISVINLELITMTLPYYLDLVLQIMHCLQQCLH